MNLKPLPLPLVQMISQDKEYPSIVLRGSAFPAVSRNRPASDFLQGVAERKNRTLIEAARTMLADSKLPTMFWTEAVSTACYVLNRVLVTRPHNKTPYELLSGKVPNISHLKPFGCHLISKAYRVKLVLRSNQPAGTYKIPTYMQSIFTELMSPFPTVIEPVHADETSLPPGHSLGSSEHSTRFPSPSDLANSISSSSEMEDIYHHPNLGDLTSTTRNNHTDYLHCLFACFLSQLEPSSVAQALNDPDWVEAMQEEMQQFINQKNKRDARGIVERKKKPDVAQGQRKEEGIYYDEVFNQAPKVQVCQIVYFSVSIITEEEQIDKTLNKNKNSRLASQQKPDGIFNQSKTESMIGSLMYLTALRPDIMFVGDCLFKTTDSLPTLFTEDTAEASTCNWVNEEVPSNHLVFELVQKVIYLRIRASGTQEEEEEQMVFSLINWARGLSALLSGCVQMLIVDVSPGCSKCSPSPTSNLLVMFLLLRFPTDFLLYVRKMEKGVVLKHERRERPMTPSQLRQYMRTYVKNQGPAVYSIGWTNWTQVSNSLTEQLQKSFDRSKRALQSTRGFKKRGGPMPIDLFKETQDW
ncbi:retrovirus-related pol polyprotein from transposon TNT 1-94 [Tanacetum coccineum]